MKSLEFKINEQIQIKFKLAAEVSDIHYCSQIQITYNDTAVNFELSNYCAGEIFEILKIKLEKTIENKLKLHKSIQEDIGFLLNEFLQKKQILPLLESGTGTDWVGVVNLIWSTDKLATWLYNKNNKIFLEITPVYSWQYLEPLPNRPHVSYDEFIKNYKPLVTVEISNAAVQQWFRQTEELLDIIKKNDEKLEKS